MLKEVLQYVVNEFSSVDKFDVEGRPYTSRPVHPLTPPLQKPLHFNTLKSLIDFANMKPAGKVMHVIDEKEVQLLSSDVDVFGQRTCYAKATTGIQPDQFSFGKYLSPEEFSIQLRTRFVEDFYLDQLLKIAGNISYSSTIDVTDDGLTQSVGQKAGVVLKSRAELPPSIQLSPFRTFLEVGQPASPFLVRARKSGELPELALFAIDGGQWRLEAVSMIQKFIAKSLHENIQLFW